MNITEDVVNEIKQLPEPVLNFAHFLKQKANRAELDNLMHAQYASMENIWDNEEDEAWNDVPIR